MKYLGGDYGTSGRCRLEKDLFGGKMKRLRVSGRLFRKWKIRAEDLMQVEEINESNKVNMQKGAQSQGSYAERRQLNRPVLPVPRIRRTPPLKWHGGKHYLARRIIELMPPHLHYVEPFFGGEAVLLAKDQMASARSSMTSTAN